MTGLLSRRCLLGGAALLLVLAVGANRAPERLHLVLLHTNDVHGQAQPRPATWLDEQDPPLIGGLPRIAAYVKRTRAEYTAEHEGVLLVDGGDWFQGTPEGLVERGRAYLEAVALVGYDVMAVGNHELDYGVAPVASMIADLGLPAACANVRDEAGGEHIDWAKPWRVVEVAGMRIGVVGLLTTTTPSITHKDASALHFQAPAEALTEAKAALADEVDWILPITHLGVVDDRRLAKAHPDLDVIVGGHSHTYLRKGLRQGETFIVQAGSKGSSVGRIDLWFDAQTKQLLEYEYQMIDLLEDHAAGEGNDEVDALCAALVKRSAEEMDRPVAELLVPLTRSQDRFESAPAGNLIADVMREKLGADFAIQNRGGIRCNLPAGIVTRRGLFEMLPFGNHLVLLEVSGETLVETVRHAVEGTAHSGLEVSGMTVLYALEDNGDALMLGIEVDGVAIDPQKMYRLATNSFLAGGADGYPELGELTRLEEDPTLLREMFEAYLRERKKVTAAQENRYAKRGQ